MANRGVKLWGYWSSIFVQRVKWALKLKGVEYEYIEEDIYNKSSQFLELHPAHKKVPVFVHDGKVIGESFIILEYIDETWKQNPLLPQDPYERAQARFWAKFGDDKIFEPGLNALFFLGEERENAIKLTIEALEKLEAELKGKGKFFGGDSLGYVDIALGWFPHLVPCFEEAGSMKLLDPVKFPALSSWMNNIANHPLIKDNSPPRNELVVYFQNRRKVMCSKPHGWIRI